MCSKATQAACHAGRRGGPHRGCQCAPALGVPTHCDFCAFSFCVLSSCEARAAALAGWETNLPPSKAGHPAYFTGVMLPKLRGVVRGNKRPCLPWPSV
jgi:hypothetical protein